ncbi:MAG: AraC family transcriptional regulator ligand-binding domain-containing protein [Methylococcaceae bacterium]
MIDIKTSAIVLPNTINTALRLGVDIQDILRKLGISIDLDHITQSIIDLKQLHAIVTAVEKASGHPAIGLLSGEDFDFDYLPHLKAFIMSAHTLREAFESTRATQKLITPLFILNMEDAGKVTNIKLKPDIALCAEDERHYTEMTFACIKSLTNRLMRKTVAPQAVHFRHGQSEITPWYADHFGSIIVLNAPENAIIYDRTIMDIPLPGRFTEIRQQAGNILKQQMADSPLQGGLAEDLKRLLATHGYLFNAPIEQVARSLNMSTRTLQRRLAENINSFAEIRDQIRFQLAAEALKSKRKSIEEIGDKLGFSDRHSFSRAFKRWSGLTPSTYRKNPSQ